MSHRFTESEVEKAALGWFSGLGYAVVNGEEIAPGLPLAERDDFGQVVLAARLRDALSRLNPTLPAEALDDAFRKLTRLDGATLEAQNRAVHRMLVDGVTVEFKRPDGSVAGMQARVVDYDDPDRNDWLAVNQFTVIENKRNRRPDVVLFVNGLPLALLELKNAANESATTMAAFRQFQTYKADIPSIFAYNAALVISDGIEARVGTLTGNREWFLPWRTIKGQEVVGPHVSELQVLCHGVFEKQRFLDLIRHFIVFSDDGGGKSLLIHFMVIAVARGEVMGGLDGFGWGVPEARKVLLVDGELPAVELAERLKSWNPDERLPSNLLICSDDASEGIPSLMTPEGRGHIEAHLDGVAMLVIDNISTLLTGDGDPNSAESWQDAQDWLLSLRRKGLAVILVDHAGKTPGRGPRGTSRKLDILDYAIELTHPANWQASEGCRFRLRFTKSRGFNDDQVAPRSARLDPDKDGKLQWTARPMGEAQREEALAMLADGASVKEVSEALDIPLANLYRWKSKAAGK